MNVYDHAHALAKAIRNSSQFREFKEAAQKLKGDDTASKMLNDFRQAQMELQKKQMENQETSQEEEKIRKLSEIVNMNLTAKDYLEKEYQFAVMVEDVQKIISEAIEEAMGSKEQGQPSPDQSDQQEP